MISILITNYINMKKIVIISLTALYVFIYYYILLGNM